MLLHVRFLVEPLPTVLTGKGSGITMDQEMSRQSRRPLEALPTLFAGEAFLLVVDSSVLTEADSMAKSLGANVTGVGPISVMGASHMHLEPVGGCEGFVALSTPENTLT